MSGKTPKRQRTDQRAAQKFSFMNRPKTPGRTSQGSTDQVGERPDSHESESSININDSSESDQGSAAFVPSKMSI